MNRIFTIIAFSVLGFFMLLVIASIIFDAPLLLGYIKSNSMSPTIEKYDLILINPLDRSFDVGDIIVFRSGDEWICHRIVGISEGFITKGDGNVVTDQFNGKDAVLPENVAGKVVVLNGKILKISGVGSYIQTFGKSFSKNKVVAFALLLSGGLLLSSDALSKKRRKKGKSIRVKYKTIYISISVVLIAVLTLATVGTFERRDISYGTTMAGGKRSEWVLPGSTFARDLVVKNNGKYPYYYVISTGKRADADKDGFLLMPGGEEMLRVTVKAPSDTALHTEKVRIFKYLPLLPFDVVKRLSEIHPFLPVVAVDVIVVLPFALSYSIVGKGEIKIRRRCFS